MALSDDPFCPVSLTPALRVGAQVRGGHDRVQRDPNAFPGAQQRPDTETVRDK